MKPVKFNEYITEESEVKKFRLLIITDEPKEAKTFHTADRLREEAEKKGYKNYLYRLSGGYMTLEDGIRRVHNKDDEKEFLEIIEYLYKMNNLKKISLNARKRKIAQIGLRSGFSEKKILK